MSFGDNPSCCERKRLRLGRWVLKEEIGEFVGSEGEAED